MKTCSRLTVLKYTLRDRYKKPLSKQGRSQTKSDPK